MRNNLKFNLPNGYNRQKLIDELADHYTIKKEPAEEDIYFKALELADKKPGSYSAKVDIQLDPDMHSNKAIKVILHFLLHVMRINEAISKMNRTLYFLTVQL